MLDFLYTLFIAPLEYWMHAALVWGYGKTANWGEAVLIMTNGRFVRVSKPKKK